MCFRPGRELHFVGGQFLGQFAIHAGSHESALAFHGFLVGAQNAVTTDGDFGDAAFLQLRAEIAVGNGGSRSGTLPQVVDEDHGQEGQAEIPEGELGLFP